MKKLFIFVMFVICLMIGVKVAQSNVKEGASAMVVTGSETPLPVVVESTPTFVVNYAVQTKEAAEAEAAVQNVTIVAGYATETASVGRTREAVALQIQADGATRTVIVHETQYAPTSEAIMLAVESDRKSVEQQKEFEKGMAVAQVFWWFFLRGIGLFALIASVRLAGKWFGKWMENAEQQPVMQANQEVDKTPLNKIEIKNGSSINFYKLPCTDEQILFIANGIVNQGRGLSYARWTPESNGFSRGDWKAIVDVLLSAGMAVYKNGNNDENGYRVTPDGWGYFQKLANRPAPLHQVAMQE